MQIDPGEAATLVAPDSREGIFRLLYVFPEERILAG
jgi:hypothetical protein